MWLRARRRFTFRPLGKEPQWTVHRRSAHNDGKITENKPRPSGPGSAVWRNTMQGLSLDLPTGYYLERDPDVLVLRRLDGSMVGAFSARGAAPEAVLRMVEESAREEPSAYLSEPSVPTRQPSLQVRFLGHFEM